VGRFRGGHLEGILVRKEAEMQKQSVKSHGGILETLQLPQCERRRWANRDGA
jgi:hypothetical protein